MQKVVIFGAICSALLVSSSASAKITPIQQYKFGELNLENNFRCEDMNGYYSSEPAGHQCSKKRFKGHECYYNCTLVCNSSDYPYTESNCVTAKHGALGGNSCTFEGITRYKTCSCSGDYTTCASPKTHSDEVCTADGEAKYKNCACPAEYQYACDGANQTGSGQSCDGRYTACNTTCSGSYNKLCDGVGEVGVGTQCGGKYQSCACASTYHTCSGTGVVGIGQACTTDGGNKYASCGCSNDYNYCASNQTGVGTPCTADGGSKYTSCQDVPTPTSCAVGDIVCSDGNCYGSSYNSCPNEGDSVIGIIFDSNRKLAITLAQYNSTRWYNNNLSVLYTGDGPCSNTGQAMNCYLYDYYTSDSTNDQASDGVRNTYLLYKEHPNYYLAAAKCAINDAAVYDSYNNGDNNSLVVGYTFHYGIPSITDWNAIKANLSTINSRLSSVGGTQIGSSTKYWTSTPYSANAQWNYTPSGGNGSFKLSSLVTCAGSCGSMYEDNTTNPQRAVRCIFNVNGSTLSTIGDQNEDINQNISIGDLP